MSSTSTSTLTYTAKAPEDTYAKFNYYEGPEPEEDDISTITGKNPGQVVYRLPVHDIRHADLSSFSIDIQGFQVMRNQSKILPPLQPARSFDFFDEAQVKATYWPEIVQLLKDTFHVRGVAPINTTLRDVHEAPLPDPRNPRSSKSMSPFFVVHGDYTPPGGRAHLRAMLPTFFADNAIEGIVAPEERENFFRLRDEVVAAEDKAVAASGLTDHWDWDGSNYDGPRYAMFSIWRPLETVERDPLAVMDGRTIRPQDLATLRRMYRRRPGFTQPAYKSTNLLPRGPGVGMVEQKANDNSAATATPDENVHKWYWISKQTPEEVWAIKLFDSEAQKKGSTVPAGVPHSAFELDGAHDGIEPRRSIEIRAFCIW